MLQINLNKDIFDLLDLNQRKVHLDKILYKNEIFTKTYYKPLVTNVRCAFGNKNQYMSRRRR